MTMLRSVSIALAVTFSFYAIPKYGWPIVLERARAQVEDRGAQPPAPPPRAEGTEQREAWTGVLLAPTVELTARLDAKLAKIYVRVGDQVKAGDVLAELDTTVQKHEIAAAAAALRASRADTTQAAVALAQAKDRASRRGAVVTYGNTTMSIVSDEEREGARFDSLGAGARVSSASANVEERAARLAQLQALVNEGTVKAPFDGLIASRFYEPGAHLRAGSPLVRLVGKGGLRVRFAVPESDGARVRLHTKIVLEWDGRSLPATVDRVAPEVEPSSGTIFVEGTVDGQENAPSALAGRIITVRLAPATGEAQGPLSDSR